ncbi:MAG TPA: Holliday junction branch migration protein RuvA, partial [Actinophytocola sp.]|nr:Holliday junction branch migration protein RuvA [Actinophytocola sp.]
KVGALPVGAPVAAGGVRSSVIEALVGLGFPARQAEQTVDGVLSGDAAADTPAVLRTALATLGRR